MSMITGILCMIIFQDKYQDSQNCICQVWWSYRKKCPSSLIFSCKIPILSLVSVLSKIFQILRVISDRMNKFRELQDYLFKFMNNFVFKFLIRLIIRRISMIICIILWMWRVILHNQIFWLNILHVTLPNCFYFLHAWLI